MKVHTMDGQVHEYASTRYLVSDTTLTIQEQRGPLGSHPATLAVFPLVNIQRWEP